MVTGIHHITAIAGHAKRNYQFYTHMLGLRFIKRTVNFDNPKTYHLYWGNASAEPGSALTFFPWENVRLGRRGTGMATEIGLSVPQDSLAFWEARFKTHHIIYNPPAEKFGETYLTFLDPDGLKLELTVAATPDLRLGHESAEVSREHAIQGFHHTTLTLAAIEPTAKILTDLLDFEWQAQEVNRYRFVNKYGTYARIVDLVEAKGEGRGSNGGGTVHHVAFRVPNDEAEFELRERLLSAGLEVTPQIDRNYFHSLYFREPGGVLFEIATDTPGFDVDEPMDALGQMLKLPPQYEAYRAQIEQVLPVLD